MGPCPVSILKSLYSAFRPRLMTRYFFLDGSAPPPTTNTGSLEGWYLSIGRRKKMDYQHREFRPRRNHLSQGHFLAWSALISSPTVRPLRHAKATPQEGELLRANTRKSSEPTGLVFASSLDSLSAVLFCSMLLCPGVLSVVTQLFSDSSVRVRIRIRARMIRR